MEKAIPNLQRIAWALCLLVAAALSIKTLQEPDLWWMLRTGEWIVENGRVVDRDVFSFTFSGVPRINVKWLFEFVALAVLNSESSSAGCAFDCLCGAAQCA